MATGEALLLAQRSGLDVEVLSETLTRRAAATDFIRHDAPAFLQGDDYASFGLDRFYEELQAIGGLADEYDVPFEVGSAVRSVFQAALERFGAADGELLAVAWLEERAGVRLRVEP